MAETSKIRTALMQAKELLPNLDQELIAICSELEKIEKPLKVNNKSKEISRLTEAMKKEGLPEEYIDYVINEAYKS